MKDTILAIDDSTDVLELLHPLLTTAGFDVLLSANSEEGIKIADSARPQLILLDVVMPHLDGFEVIKRLKSNRTTQDIPIIFMTALAEIDHKLKGFEAGAADYITKPIQYEEMLARVNSHLKIYKLQLQLQERTHQLEEQTVRLAKSRDDLLSVLNQLQIGTVITDTSGHVVFLSESCKTFNDLNQDRVLGQRWENVLPFDIYSKEQLRLMMKKPAEQRTRVSLTWENKAQQRYWVDCDIRDDPRKPQRHILYLYDKSEVHNLRNQLSQTQYGQIVGSSEAMQRMYEQLENIAQGNWTVMIEGETGVGKELVARGIHAASSRKHGPFIAVNCAGLSESLLTSQLFGHRKGAFTGAIADQKGVFEAANGGTLFLDEIGDIPLNMQSTLLRTLQEREITRLGESKVHKIDVRILTATHKELKKEIAEGRFREDLFYRLCVARIRVPPLRERREDIPLLVSAFLAEDRMYVGKIVNQVSTEAMRYLLDYYWPGNVRELKNTVEYAVIYCHKSIIQPEDLPPELLDSTSNHQLASNHQEVTKNSLQDEIIESEEDEQTHLLKALKKANGNRTRAAQLLGISRATLYRHLVKFGIYSTK